MKIKKGHSEKNEFLEFISCSEKQYSQQGCSSPPASLNAYISSGLKRETLFFNGKWILVSIFSLFISLLFCPQLGFGYFGGHYGLLHYFMAFGALGCAFLCAGFLVSFTSLTLYLALNNRELKRLGAQRFKVIVLYNFLVFILFYLLGSASINSELIAWGLGLGVFAIFYSVFLPKVQFQSEY